MATKERLEKSIVALDGKIEAAETPEERAALIAEMEVLAKAYRGLEGQAQPDD